MGNKHSALTISDAKRQKALEKAWANRSEARTSKQWLKRATTLFKYYDTDNDGILYQREAERYIDDLLSVSGFKHNIVAEARNAGIADVQSLYSEYVTELFLSMDRNRNGCISLEELLAPQEAGQFVKQAASRIRKRRKGTSILIKSSKLQKHGVEGAVVTEDEDNRPTAPPAVATSSDAKCANGCGFFASANCDGYCEECFAAIETSLRKTSKRVNDSELTATSERTDASSYSSYSSSDYEGSSDEDQMSAAAATTEESSSVAAHTECPVCEADLSKFDLQAARHHVNECLGAGDAGDDADDDDNKGKAEESTVRKKPRGKGKGKGRRRGKGKGKGKGKGRRKKKTTKPLPVPVTAQDIGVFFDEASESEEKLWTVVSQDQLEELQERKLEDAKELVGLSAADTALILQEFGWDVEKMQALYFTKMEEYQQRAGVMLDAPGHAKVADGEEVECSICFDDVDASDSYGLECGHGPFCKGCWSDQMHSVATSATAHGVLNVKCMQQGCPIKLNRDDWHALGNTEDVLRYDYFYKKLFVESTKNIGFCPNINCSYAVKYSGYGRPSHAVECMCGQAYCFACLKSAHNPATCDQMELFFEQNEDAADLNLIKSLAKICPFCGTAIERNQGCNHMTCRRNAGGCGGEFCYICLGPWSEHGEATGGYYNCNRPKPAEEADLQGEMAEAQRYSFFRARYDNHIRMLDDTKELRDRIVADVCVQYREVTTLDPEFLVEATDQLVKIRKVLANSYIYAWGINRSESSEFTLFEFQQGSLEGVADRLGELLFMKIGDMVLKENLYDVVRAFCAQASSTLTALMESLQDRDSDDDDEWLSE